LAEEAPTDVYGAWITVHLIDEGARPHLAGEFSVDFADSLGYRPPLAGELLAVDADSVFVLVGGRAGSCPVTAIGKQDVAKAQVAYFDPEGERAGNWIFGGSLLSLSNGWAAGITLPMWWIIGGTMASSQHSLPLKKWPQHPWEELGTYARFPQGRPPHLRAEMLPQKPRWYRPKIRRANSIRE